MKTLAGLLVLMANVDDITMATYWLIRALFSGENVFVPTTANLLFEQAWILGWAILAYLPLALLWRSRMIFEIILLRFSRGSSG